MFKELLLASTAVIFSLNKSEAGPLPQPVIIGRPPGSQAYSYSLNSQSVAQRLPLPTDDGTGLASSTGPCSIGYIWTYVNPFLNGNQTQVYVATSCLPGAAKWSYTPNPGLVLDAVGGAGNTTGHGWAYFQAAKAATNAFHITDGGSNNATISFLSNGLADYATADKFVAATPQACSNIPNYDSAGSIGYCPTNQAIVDITYDQSQSGTVYNSADTTGIFQTSLTSSTGTFHNNDTITIGTLAGCTTQIAPAIMSIRVTGIAPQPISYSSSSSFTQMGECAGGSISASQTMSATSGTGSTAVFGVTPFNEAPVWNTENQVGYQYRGAVFNSTVAQLNNELIVQKGIYVPSIPWTPSSSTAILVMKHVDGTMSSGAGLYEAPAITQQVQGVGNSLSAADAITLGNAKGACNLAVKSSPSVLAITWIQGFGGLSCKQDNRYSGTSTGGTSTATTGLNIGSFATQYISGHFVLAGFFLWTTPLTTAQLQTAMISLAYQGQLIQPTDTALMTIGDSTYAGSGDFSNATSVWDQTIKFSNRTLDYYNQAFHGQVLACGSISGTAHVCTGQAVQTMEGRAVGGQSFTNRYDPTLKTNIVVLNGGQNDIRGGNSAAMIEGGIQAIVNAVHANVNNAGIASHIILSEFTPSCDLVNNGTELTTMEQLDYWEETQTYVPQAQGGVGLNSTSDTFVPIAADPVLSAGYLGPVNGSQTGNVTLGATSFCNVPVIAVGTLTSGSTTVTGLSGYSTLAAVGNTVYPSPGIPQGTTVTQTQGSAIVMSNAATFSNSSANIIISSNTSNLIPHNWSPDGVHEYVPYMKQWAAVLQSALNNILTNN